MMIKVDESYCIEAIILKIPERREVQTKSGELIALSEMFVEDDTGQIWVKGWRNQARLIDKCESRRNCFNHRIKCKSWT